EARAKAAAERAEQEARARSVAERIPEDIQQVLQHRGHALLIGQSHYTRGWDELASVRYDLQTLKAGLTPYFETVEIVQDPTVSQLRDRMREFLLGQWNMPDERLFIYYAGHGFTDFNQASRENNGYITGSDTPRYDLTPGKAIENAVPFTDIDAWNRQTRARHVLMVFDSCFSGTLFQTMGSEEEPSRKDRRHPENAPSASSILHHLWPQRGSGNGRQHFRDAALAWFARRSRFLPPRIRLSRSAGDLFEPRGPQTQSAFAAPQFSSIGNAKLSEGQFFFLTGIAATS